MCFIMSIVLVLTFKRKSLILIDAAKFDFAGGDIIMSSSVFVIF